MFGSASVAGTASFDLKVDYKYYRLSGFEVWSNGNYDVVHMKATFTHEPPTDIGGTPWDNRSDIELFYGVDDGTSVSQVATFSNEITAVKVCIDEQDRIHGLMFTEAND